MSARTLLERHQQRIPTRHRPQAGASLSSLGLRLPGAVSLSWTAPSLQNSWIAYDAANYHTAEYARTSEGIVMVRGAIKNGTATGNILLFTLPVGYRPSKRLIFVVSADSNDEVIDVLANGEVRLMTASSAVWLTLNSIIFDAS